MDTKSFLDPRLITVASQDGTFPLTRHSLVLAARCDDPAERSLAVEAITIVYWRPVYKYVRLKWHISREDGADFTQEFFAHLLEKKFLDAYDSRKGRLRTFLRTCVDRLFMNQMRDSTRRKRGGGIPHVSLDFEEAERELAAIPSSESPETRFDKEWVRSLFALGLQRLKAGCESRGKMMHFELFELYDLQDADPKPSYEELARKFGLAATDVTNYLAFARREFRRCVLDQLREMTTSDQEFHLEAQVLLGVDIG
jgi:DNA-directed RNA polymerase specialized sigma24 family protein